MRALFVVLCAAAAASSPACGPSAPAVQHEVTAGGELLTSDGRLREPGWSRQQLQHWNAAQVHDAPKLRQWDFFSVMDDAKAANVTLVDLGFAQAATVGVVDFATGRKTETTTLKDPADVFTLSPAIEGAASLVQTGAPVLAFDTGADHSSVSIALPMTVFGAAASGALLIARRPAMQYLSLATPFAGDAHQFFYEQKLPGMAADGTITIGAQSWTFAGASAVMDWGRGEWPSSATWRWAAASGDAGGATLAFNLGEGFGDASAGTENVVVAADVAHKLGTVDWTHDAQNPLADWTFRARDGRLTLTLHPIAQEVGGLELGTKHSRLHKAYGRYAGSVVLDDGRTVAIDGMLGFAEEMELAW
jgi:Domain of unknown function (DUF2804), N-terminal/Domain of unknown function (DUF2804), C-terminal